MKVFIGNAVFVLITLKLKTNIWQESVYNYMNFVILIIWKLYNMYSRARTVFMCLSNIQIYLRISNEVILIVPDAQCAQYYKRGGNNVAYLFIYPPTL